MARSQIQSISLGPRKGLIARLVTVLTLFRARRRTRHGLAHLDQRLLRDIGVDAGTARREATKPFWQP